MKTKKFVNEAWKRDGYSCQLDYQWEHLKYYVFHWFSDPTNPSFPLALDLLEWAKITGKLTDKKLSRYESGLAALKSKFGSEEELEEYLEKIHGKP